MAKKIGSTPLRYLTGTRFRPWLLIVLTLGLVQSMGCKRPSPTSTGIQVNTISVDQIDFQTVEVDPTLVSIALYYQKPDGTRFGNFDSLKNYLAQSHQQLLFATNAGMFDPKFTPCGLTVVAGQEEAPLNLKDGIGNFYLKPNGVFMISDGRPMIVDSTQYPAAHGQVQLATQSGPLLLISGQINSKFDPRSESRKIRSGVGIRQGNIIVFAISHQPVTFDEFALLFRDHLHCSDALYLDGTISQFYLPSDGQKLGSQNFAGILAIIARN